MFIVMYDNGGQQTLSWVAQSLWALALRPSICTRSGGMPPIPICVCLFYSDIRKHWDSYQSPPIRMNLPTRRHAIYTAQEALIVADDTSNKCDRRLYFHNLAYTKRECLLATYSSSLRSSFLINRSSYNFD